MLELLLELVKENWIVIALFLIEIFLRIVPTDGNYSILVNVLKIADKMLNLVVENKSKEFEETTILDDDGKLKNKKKRKIFKIK